MNAINPTIRMWKNRIERVASVWSDPDQPARKFEIGYNGVINIAAIIGAALVAYYVYLTISSDTWWRVEKILPYVGMELFVIFGIAYFIGRPDAKRKSKLGDHAEKFWVFLIMWLLIGGVFLLIGNESFQKDKPVTQGVYAEAKAVDPSCNRIDDYRTWRSGRDEIFIVRDINRAIRECAENKETAALLAKQKALK